MEEARPGKPTLHTAESVRHVPSDRHRRNRRSLGDPLSFVRRGHPEAQTQQKPSSPPGGRGLRSRLVVPPPFAMPVSQPAWPYPVRTRMYRASPKPPRATGRIPLPTTARHTYVVRCRGSPAGSEVSRGEGQRRRSQLTRRSLLANNLPGLSPSQPSIPYIADGWQISSRRPRTYKYTPATHRTQRPMRAPGKPGYAMWTSR